MNDQPARPKRYEFAIRKQGASSEDFRVEVVHALSEEDARRRIAQSGQIDPHTEEIVGVQELA